MTDGEKMIYAAVWAEVYRYCIKTYHTAELVAAQEAAELAHYAIKNLRMSVTDAENEGYYQHLIEMIGKEKTK